MDNYEKILDGIKKIEISQAVTHEKLGTMKDRINDSSVRLDIFEKRITMIDKRIDRHDKIVGAIVIAVSILATLFKFKII